MRQLARNASATGIFAARIDGNKPPINPIKHANPIPAVMSVGLTYRLNTRDSLATPPQLLTVAVKNTA